MKAIKEGNTIVIGKARMELTPERKRRIEQAMIETQNKLDKELTYSEDLQHKDMIQSYQEHIEYLVGLLK